MSFPHNLLLNINDKKKMIKFRNILLVSICFNDTYFICQKKNDTFH